MRWLFRAGALLALLALQGFARTAELSASETPPESPRPLAWLTGMQKRLALKGYVEGIHSAKVSRPEDAPSSRISLRLESEADFKPVYGFVSLNAEANGAIPDETGLKLRELWLEYVGQGWDVRVGRQIIIWGKADSLQVTDIISPPDYTEAMTRDLDDIRLPVDAARLRVMGIPMLGKEFNLELIAIPAFRAAVMAEGDNPWAAENSLPAGVHRHSASAPAPSLANMELAGKISGYFSGLDVAASVFHTWDDMPAYFVTAEDGAVHIRPEHKRMTVVGLEFSRPWADFVFRGEAAWFFGRYRATENGNSVRRDSLKWLLGLDWTPGDDWTAGVQFMSENIFDYSEDIADNTNDAMATLNLSKKFFNQLITISNMIFIDVNDGSIYNRAKAEYEISDGLIWSIGFDYFSNNGQYGQYYKNNFVWTKLKYSF